MIHWRIYYDDGTTFDSEDGEPEDAPGLGILCIVQRCPDYGRQVMSGWDYYYYRDSSPTPWWGCCDFGLIDNLTSNPRGTRAVKAGRTVASVDYQRVKDRASKDPDFNPVSSPRAHQTPSQNSKGQV